MGGSKVQVNKAHKSRFASKSSRKAHKVPLAVKSRIGKAEKKSMKGARATRIQRSKMMRDQKRATLLKEKRASGGPSSAPRIIVLCGLSSSLNLNMLAKELFILLSGEESEVISATVASQTYKLRTTVLVAPYGDLVSCMEMAKVADLIAFVVSANSFEDGCETSPIDSFGIQCLSVFRAIGLPSTTVLIRDLPGSTREKQDAKKIAISCLGSELPEDCRFYPADTKEELHKFLWLFKEQHLSVPHWRSQRPYLMSQEVGLELENNKPGKCTLLLSGYVRAQSLSVNQLVHVSGAGDFQFDKIDVLKDPVPLNERKGSNLMDSDNSNCIEVVLTLKPDALKQEPLVVENIPDPLAGEQTWPTEADMAEADENNERRKLRRKKLPPGTSDYQAAWIVEDSDDDVSEGSVEEGDGMVLDGQKYNFAQVGSNQSDSEIAHNMENFDEETEADTEMADDANLTSEQIEAEIKKLKDACGLDEEFPDEVDTPIDVPAKKRFAKYRGLKSFRTSSWDPQESLPPEYAKIFNFDNFTKTQNHVLAKVLNEEHVRGSLQVGSYVRLHVKDVPVDLASKVYHLSQSFPVVACGLLQHESKMSVLHFSIKKHDSYDDPIKSKEIFTFHVGFRHFIARPIFSSDNINSDKHKMERFLLPGRFSIASIYAPICFPPMPLVVLKNKHGDSPAVAAVGSLRSVDPYRIILKKIILTGYPLRVSKKKATVRYMFHNPDDVRWFKPVELYTKCGRRGLIKDSVGTHGAMKCLFNGVIQQHDTVCMSLYKRAYPKWPEQLFPLAKRRRKEIIADWQDFV
ncbi:pre-rRNA-processing protein TSR1 homolog [Phalaenopsis equestris]|uniref:pre-rRNA-processing protein TSR1 homolog n=1 Tax=Phalaenopsis equestris TaxID=78828 RepID=UPI0009E1B189|nr:pre-rRNA-processing protein TSR1 homolog [Phalaenopsis equestris]